MEPREGCLTQIEVSFITEAGLCKLEELRTLFLKCHQKSSVLKLCLVLKAITKSQIWCMFFFIVTVFLLLPPSSQVSTRLVSNEVPDTAAIRWL